MNNLKEKSRIAANWWRQKIDSVDDSNFDNGEPSIFAPIMIATLSMCSQVEKTSIQFRLQSGYKRFIEKGGKVGRKVGYTKSREKKEDEYKDAIRYLRKGFGVRDTAKITGTSERTVARLKKEFCK